MARGRVFITPGGLEMLQVADGVTFARLMGQFRELQTPDDRLRDPLGYLGFNNDEKMYDPRPQISFFAPEWGDI